MISKKSVFYIDIAITDSNDISKTHGGTIRKYIELSIKKQWALVNIRTIPIIVLLTGIIPKNLHIALEELELIYYIIEAYSIAINSKSTVKLENVALDQLG